MKASEIAELLPYMTAEERAELNKILAADKAIWRPQPGPQSMAYNSEATIIGYGGAAGGGKLLWVETDIPTPAGWAKIAHLQPGDQILDERGCAATVTVVSPLVEDPKTYKLTFDDGEELYACADHRWLTFDAKELAALTRRDPEWQARRRAGRPSKIGGKKSAAFSAAIAKRNSERVKGLPAPAGTVRTTQEIVDTLVTPSGRHNHAVPVAKALQLPEADLPLDPYVLGAWLGDGSKDSARFTGVDPEIRAEIEGAGFKVTTSATDPQAHYIRGLSPILRGMGLLHNKHVPAAYLRASEAQRLALLQGLMDTDGHAALDGGSEFDNTNRELAEATLELVRSLGIKASFQEGVAKLNGRVIGPKWRVKFTTTKPVFRLPRKLARLPQVVRRTQIFRYIVSAEEVAPRPMRCIAVDSPSHLYLAGRGMIPTHNTDLLLGTALTQHRRGIIFRREGTQLQGIYDRLGEILGGREGFNSQDKIWRPARVPSVQLEFGSAPNPDDVEKYQGRAHDFKGFDEATGMLEAQVRYLLTWLRTTVPGQRVKALLTFNPPTTAEGRWIISYFAPWLDDKHPRPADPGEIRWFASVGGEEVEVDSGDAFKHRGELITPVSRTFVASRITDNPFLMGTGYMAQLQSLPEPLRSQMLHGDFMAGTEDDPWQVIPTKWVDEAQRRWEPKHAKGPMDSLGVDVARGGRDETIICARYGTWFDELKAYPGESTPDGPSVAGLVISQRRDLSPVHIDLIGWGASAYDFLVSNGIQSVGINGSNKSLQLSKEGGLRFVNHRAELWWRMREALDPINPDPIALPPDNKLRGDLCAPRWKLAAGGIQIEAKDEVIRRIGRSPDRGDAACMALIATEKDGADDRSDPHARRGQFGSAGWLA